MLASSKFSRMSLLVPCRGEVDPILMIENHSLFALIGKDPFFAG
jgi:hypothetical protein